MRSYFRYFHEIFRLPKMATEEVVRRTHVIGAEHVHDNVAAGRGVVLALPHMGNWDQAGAWLVGVGHPFTTVAERLKPESLFHRYVRFREGLGMEVLPLTGGDGHNFGTLATRVRKGGVVCLPAERDLTKSGIEVRVLRRDHQGARRAAAAGRADGRGAAAGHRLLRRRRLGHPHPRGDPGPEPRAPARRRWRPWRRGWPACSRRASPSTRRTGTCCSGCGWRICAHEGRHRLPVFVGHAGRRQAARRRPGPGADRARARRLGDRAGRRGRRAASVRDRSRPGGAGALQRVGGQDVVRVHLGGPGAALGARRRLRRAAHP